ncbi:hypothetical protein Nepgr_000477 [Nepenthes gracilis]|uniref:plastoquinol--plastocyanin reductase n=1 Tax=Nepenthes gracilis TaxID=150966 RepID=A0AAD3RWW2_NEPGR|nr:hypothetical protein Nepgr_000477 [Nepenthes gracilis]
MASSTFSPATPSQLCSCKSGMFSPSIALAKASRANYTVRKEKGRKITCQAASIPADDRVPDMGKRQLMNLLLLGAISLPTAAMLVPYVAFFVPPGSNNASAGTIAKDAVGNDVIADQWLKTHKPGDRTLAQGLKGDPTYLVVENDGTLATYGINAVCTHLGCVVPWNAAENKFICPCHGSQYNNQEGSSEDLHLCPWHWLIATLMRGRWCLSRGLKKILELVNQHGGLRNCSYISFLPFPPTFVRFL